jgi:hypothetical protein
MEKGCLYGLHIANLRPASGTTLCANVPDPGIPLEYVDFAYVFSEDEASDTPEHGPHDLAIDLYEGRHPP